MSFPALDALDLRWCGISKSVQCCTSADVSVVDIASRVAWVGESGSDTTGATDDDGWNAYGNGGSGSDDDCRSDTGKCGSGDSCGNGDSCGGDGCGCAGDNCGNGGDGCSCAGDSCGGGCAGDSCSVGDNCESGTGVVSSVVSSIHTTVCTWMDIKYKNKITMNILCHTKCIRYYIILV